MTMPVRRIWRVPIGVLLREDIIGGNSVSVRLRKRRVNLRIFNDLWETAERKEAASHQLRSASRR